MPTQHAPSPTDDHPVEDFALTRNQFDALRRNPDNLAANAPVEVPPRDKPKRRRRQEAPHDRSHHRATILDVTPDPTGRREFTIPATAYARKPSQSVMLDQYNATIASPDGVEHVKVLRYADARDAYGRTTVTMVDHVRRAGAFLYRAPYGGSRAAYIKVQDFERILRQDFSPEVALGKRLERTRAHLGVPFGPDRVLPVIQVSPGQYRFRVSDLADATGVPERTVYALLYACGMTEGKHCPVLSVRDYGRSRLAWAAEPLYVAWAWTVLKPRIVAGHPVCTQKLISPREVWDDVTESWEPIWPGTTPSTGYKLSDYGAPRPQHSVTIRTEEDGSTVPTIETTLPHRDTPAPAAALPVVADPAPAVMLTPEGREEVLALLDALEQGK